MYRAIAAALVLAASPALADPVLGVWQTQPDDGAYAHVTMAPCGPAICGKITRTFNSTGEYRSPNIGKTLVIDMKPAGNGRYNGQVWRPSNDKIYTGKIDLAGDQLKLAGCVAGGLLCSSQTWVRVK
jgi:uncharacterized protein (DUF2147 family)